MTILIIQSLTVVIVQTFLTFLQYLLLSDHYLIVYMFCFILTLPFTIFLFQFLQIHLHLSLIYTPIHELLKFYTEQLSYLYQLPSSCYLNNNNNVDLMYHLICKSSLCFTIELCTLHETKKK